MDEEGERQGNTENSRWRRWKVETTHQLFFFLLFFFIYYQSVEGAERKEVARAVKLDQNNKHCINNIR